MPNLNYQQNMTGVMVPRSEVLNSRPWAITKFIGFVIGTAAVAAVLMLVGALLLAGVSLRNPVVPPSAPAGAPQQQPAPQPSPGPAPPAQTQITVPLPEIRVVLPPRSRQSQPAPASDDEALERNFKGRLLTEGEDP